MKIIEKDILTVEKGIICQSVNCQGKMNSGLAKQIREKYPEVYERYLKLYQSTPFDFLLLGHEQIIHIGDSLLICNIFGQLNFGYDGKRYTDYGSLQKAFNCLFEMEALNNYQFYFPFNFGCDRGGADWNIVSKMIDYYFPEAIICKLPEK